MQVTISSGPAHTLDIFVSHWKENSIRTSLSHCYFQIALKNLHEKVCNEYYSAASTFSCKYYPKITFATTTHFKILYFFSCLH